jgi:hypothetical protein
MNSPAQNAAISENEANSKAKLQSTAFKPKATLLLDVQPGDSLKKPANKQEQDVRLRSVEAPGELLQQLLMNTEASALRTQSVKMKWQLATLILGLLLASAGAAIGWLVAGTNADGNRQGQMEMQNMSLKGHLDAANAQVAGLKSEIDTLVNRNLELAGENAQLKSQIKPSAAVASTSPTAAKTIAAATSAIDLQKGTYPKGASRAELTAVLGEPDRVYKTRNYEQLVYFGRKPGRFWFIGGFLVQTTE